MYKRQLWYSAIVRFHVHSGMAYWTDTLSLLFPNQTSYPKVGDMMPNETMQQIVRQLPEGALDLRDLALHHSLFPFRLRFLPTQKKQDLSLIHIYMCIRDSAVSVLSRFLTV